MLDLTLFNYYKEVSKIYKTYKFYEKIKFFINFYKKYIQIYIKNPKVILSFNKVLNYNHLDYIDIFKLDKILSENINNWKSEIIKETNTINFYLNQINYNIKIDYDLCNIIIKTQDYSFFPFRNHKEIKYLIEDFKAISNNIEKEVSKYEKNNEFIECQIILKKIYEKKFDFYFDGCLIIAKNNNITITEIKINKNYEDLIKGAIYEWFKKIN